MEPFNIASNHKDCRRMESYTVFTPALEATKSTKMFGKLPSVNCYLARENLVISMIHMPWLLLREVLKLRLLAMYMYRMPYLRFAARFPICSFSGVKCWYGDRLDVTVVTSHVTTTYNFAETTFTSWLQTAKFTKVFSLESFPLYGRYTVYVYISHCSQPRL